MGISIKVIKIRGGEGLKDLIDLIKQEIEEQEKTEEQREHEREQNNERVLEKIISKTGRKPSECSCDECKLQCETPCLGTPDDILKLIEAGHAKNLDFTIWMNGYAQKKCLPIPMIQPKKTEAGCVFFKNGLCELHDSGLKPTEGKLAHHSITFESLFFEKTLNFNVAIEWVKPNNRHTVLRIIDLLEKFEEEREQNPNR